MLGYEILEDFHMGYENLKQKLDGLRIFWRKNYISFLPSFPVLGIYNDQSLSSLVSVKKLSSLFMNNIISVTVSSWTKQEHPGAIHLLKFN